MVPLWLAGCDAVLGFEFWNNWSHPKIFVPLDFAEASRLHYCELNDNAGDEKDQVDRKQAHAVQLCCLKCNTVLMLWGMVTLKLRIGRRT